MIALTGETARGLDRVLFEAGQAAGMLAKAGSAPESVYALSGRLVVSQSGWGLLELPNALVRGLYAALDEPGIELPPGPSGQLNAHISVFRKEEVAKLGGPDAIKERGKLFRFQTGPIRKVKPAGWEEMSACWLMEVTSPSLKALRRSYGLSDLPKGFAFHLTIAVRKKGVLGANDVSKAAASTHTVTRGDVTYDIGRLIDHLAGRPVESVSIADLAINRSRNTGFGPRRLAAADTSYPGILDESGAILDGKHRAAKLVDAGETHAPFRRATADDLEAVRLKEAVMSSSPLAAATAGRPGPSPLAPITAGRPGPPSLPKPAAPAGGLAFGGTMPGPAAPSPSPLNTLTGGAGNDVVWHGPAGGPGLPVA